MSDAAIEIRQAKPEDVPVAAALFDEYRRFYRQDPDPDGAAAFVGARLALGDSALFLARVGGRDAGFTQLYPSFSSVSMGRIFVLNDLYVRPDCRRGGVGAALMRHAEEYAAAQGALRLALATERGNATAQALYERMGWSRDEVYFHYDKACPPAS